MNHIHAGGVSKRPTRISELVEFSYSHHDLSLSPITLSGVPDLNSSRDRDGNRSSVSSEGFCENDGDADMLNESGVLMGPALQVSGGDTDSQEGGGSDSASSSGASTSIGQKQRGAMSSMRNSHLKSMASAESQSEDSDNNSRRKSGASKVCLDYTPAGMSSVMNDIGSFSDVAANTSSDTSRPFSASKSAPSFLMSTPTSSSQRKAQLQQPAGLPTPTASPPEVLDADSDVSGEPVSTLCLLYISLFLYN